MPVVGITVPAIDDERAAKVPLSSSNSSTVVPSLASSVSWLSVLFPALALVITAA